MSNSICIAPASVERIAFDGDQPPQLAVVVDTEEEFDWSAPLDRASRSVRSIAGQPAAHDVYDRFGLVPTYVVDHPVATDDRAVATLQGLATAGQAEIGTHLHPWVTPPHLEQVNARNSYHCNLPPSLERAKIAAATEAVATAFGSRPTIFKAGRYGFGRNTLAALAEKGYRVDCSFVPHVSFAADGGPVYRGVPDSPFWLDRDAGLLEVPMTSGFIGPLRGAGPRLAGLFDDPVATRLRVPGMLAKAKLVARSRLTPEGVSAAEQCALLAALNATGRRFFTLTYHSPSLVPGHTPYVRDRADLAAFLATITEVLTYFRDTLGGEFTTLTRLRDSIVAPAGEAAAPAAGATRR